MTRTWVAVGVAAVLALAGLAAVTGGAQDATGTPDLGDRISEQTDATAEALALADDPWVPRTAGLGVGLAAGLLAGGLAAYARKGGRG